MKASKVESWQEDLVGEVVKLNYGKELPRNKRNKNGKVPVYGSNGVIGRTDLQYARGRASIVVGRKGSAGENTKVLTSFWPLDVSYFTSHDQSRLDFDFLYYILKSLDLPRLARGVKPGINRNEVYALTIRFPSLEEQRRIVVILDKAFEGLEQVQSYTESNLADLEELSLSFLKDAISGWETVNLGEVVSVCEWRYTEYICTGILGWRGELAHTERHGGMSGREIEQTSRTLTESGLKHSSARIVPQDR